MSIIKVQATKGDAMNSETISEIIQHAKTEVSQAQAWQQLEDLRIKYLGKKGSITTLLKNVVTIPVEQRRAYGQMVNDAKLAIQEVIQNQADHIKNQQLANNLQAQALDITLPGRGQPYGSIHPVTQTIQRISEYFEKIGFAVVSGPEVEDEYHNFLALNMPEHHPARAMQDTFYLNNGLLLRTHTSGVQIRTLETHDLPVRVIAPGRVYRSDDIDMTHTPMFHQVEGLIVDEDIHFSHLKSILGDFLNYYFETNVKTRFRPSYFPFTEPSAEVDMACIECRAQGCRLCKNTGWLEILGCGMVHPQVLNFVNIDTERYSGFAFGMGVDRLVLLRHQMGDLRLLFENDVRFLQQF